MSFSITVFRSCYKFQPYFLLTVVETSNEHEKDTVGIIRFRKIKICFFRLSFCPSVCPQGTTRLPLDGLSSNIMFEYFSKICPENSSFIKIRLRNMQN